MKNCTDRRSAYASELRGYLQDINEVALLSRREEVELAERIARGDPYARDRLIQANLRLVVRIAKSYLGRGLPLDDLIAEGNLGVIRAVEAYDGQAGVRFSTYASHWIKQSIRRALIMQVKPIRLPHNTVTLLSKWRRASAVLAERSGRQPTREEVGLALRLSEKTLALVAQALEINRLVSQSGRLVEDDDFLEDLLTDDRSRAPEDLVIEADELERIFAAIDHLDEREASILRMRFGLDSDAPMTLSEIGKILGLTRARIQQIEAHSIRRLVTELDDPTEEDTLNGDIQL